MSDVAKISELMLRKIIKEKLERQSKKKKDKKEFLFEHVSVLSTSLDKKILTKIIAHKLNEAAEPGGAGGEDLDLEPIDDVFDSLFISGQTTTVSPTTSRSSESEKSKRSKNNQEEKTSNDGKESKKSNDGKESKKSNGNTKETVKPLILKVRFINLGDVYEGYTEGRQNEDYILSVDFDD